MERMTWRKVDIEQIVTYVHYGIYRQLTLGVSTRPSSPAPASELVEPPLEGGVEAEVVDELLEALLVLALCEVEGDLDLRLGGQTQ